MILVSTTTETGGEALDDGSDELSDVAGETSDDVTVFSLHDVLQ